MKVLVVGSGGREHAISWALAKSPIVNNVICIPGNGGTARESKCINIDPSLYDCPENLRGFERYAFIAKQEGCQMAVIGPEDPLAQGIVDYMGQYGIPTVGPHSQGAALESSKDTAKQFMKKYGVACAESVTCTDAQTAHKYIESHGVPVVIKADGLAGGKGVVVAKTLEDAHKAVDDFMNNNILGDAGKKLVIEDFLQGTEISILAAVSVTPELAAAGKACIVPFLPARDHKRLNDGAKGPNTGGMGAVCPVTDITEKQLEDFHHCILQPTVNGMIAEQMDYRGFIFFGLMMTADGPKLLEYNVRLGDPETQAVLPLMDCDFAALCSAIIDGKLQDFPILWKPGFNCAPVAVSGGYPGKYAKGIPISFNDTECDSEQVKIFIAGAQEQDGMLVTSGGRVLAVCSHGDTFEQAHKQAYQALQSIHFDGMFYRKDIGLPGAADSI